VASWGDRLPHWSGSGYFCQSNEPQTSRRLIAVRPRPKSFTCQNFVFGGRFHGVELGRAINPHTDRLLHAAIESSEIGECFGSLRFDIRQLTSQKHDRH